MGSACLAADPPVVLKGRVVDENGLPVGGAQVKLEVAGGQIFSAVSDDAGFFSIADFPVGQATVRVQKWTFFVLADQNIQVSEASSEFTFILNHEEEVKEKVDVTVTTERIDPAQAPQTEELSAREIRDVPVASSHTLQQSLVILPQVVRDNLNFLHVVGARTTQTQYLLDGFDIGDPVSGQLDARFSVDAVRLAEVQTGRMGAEYAHPGAAVMNFDTPDGDDKWRFGMVDFIPSVNVQQGVQVGSFYPRFSLSGPIEKGKLWFSESVTLQHTLGIVKGLPSNADTQTGYAGDSLTRILWLVSPKHSIHGEFLYNQDYGTNGGLSTLRPQNATVNQNGHRIFASFLDQLWWQRTLFQLGISADQSYVHTYPQGTEPYIQLVNGADGNWFERIKTTGHRYQGFASVSKAELPWHGTHTISIGANLSSVDLGQNATRSEIRAVEQDGTTLIRLSSFTGAGQYAISDTLAGMFVQDGWKINKHLFLQSGLRLDLDRYVEKALPQPRITLNYLPMMDNRSKLSIGWGMYSIPLNLSQVGLTMDQHEVDTTYAPDGISPVVNGAVSQFVLGGNWKMPYFAIANASWEQRIAARTLVTLDALARDEHHGLVYQAVTPGQIGSEFLLETARRDKYRALTVSVKHLFENGTILFGAYTRSNSSTDQALDPYFGQLYFAAQQWGRMAWDAPNRVVTWGSVPTPIWGLLFAYFYEYRTGYPFNVINQQEFLVGAPYTQRFPYYSSLTVSLEKPFRFTKYIFAVRVAAVNIMNRENPDTVINNIDATGATPGFLAYSGGQGRAITARLRFVGKK
jgi:Carboxypeptidase regulatory-like domain